MPKKDITALQAEAALKCPAFDRMIKHHDYVCFCIPASDVVYYKDFFNEDIWGVSEEECVRVKYKSLKLADALKHIEDAYIADRLDDLNLVNSYHTDVKNDTEYRTISVSELTSSKRRLRIAAALALLDGFIYRS